MSNGITMERRSEFRAKLRKPKQALWLGCVVKSVEEGVSKARGMPYVKIRFDNCPFVLIVNPYDLMNAEKIAREYGMTPPTAIEVGELLNLNVSWRKTPDWLRRSSSWANSNRSLGSSFGVGSGFLIVRLRCRCLLR
jgi:hypothetical protein